MIYVAIYTLSNSLDFVSQIATRCLNNKLSPNTAVIEYDIRTDGNNLLYLTFFRTQVLAGPHEGQTLQLKAGGAEVRVGRGAPKENGLRLDKDLEVSDKCVV